MLEVNRARLAVHAHSSPVPKLKGKDIRRGAYFKDHASRSTAVYRSSGNKDVVVLSHRPTLSVLVSIKGSSSLLSRLKLRNHGTRVYSLFEAKVDMGVRLGIEHVVTFVLSVMHAKLFLNVLCQRVYLKGEVAPSHGVEEIKSNGKLSPKSSMYSLSEKALRFLKDKVNRRGFEIYAFKA